MTAALSAPISITACPAGSGSLDRLVRQFRAGSNDGEPVRLLPLGRLPATIEPVIGRPTRAAQGRDDLRGCVAGNVVSETHVPTVAGKTKIGNAENNACQMSAMPTQWRTMKTLVEPQVAFTDFEYGRRAALRGCYRILCCPESPAAYREWLAGYDSVRREDRGKWPLVGPVPAALQYLANNPAD